MPITLKNVDFDFSFSRFSIRRKILKNINLNVPHGVVIALVGATGSGKSTLISLFNGLLLPEAGRVRVNNYSFYKGISSQRIKHIIKAVRREVNISFQFPEYQLFEDTVEKEIIFGPKNLAKKKYNSFFNLIRKLKVSSWKKTKYFYWYFFKLKKMKAKSWKNFRGDKRSFLLMYEKWNTYQETYKHFFAEIAKKTISLVGLEEKYLRLSPFGLSGGEKRRVALAATIAIGGQFLVLDEPTAGLDPQSENNLINLLLNLNQEERKTIVVITHNMDHVLAVADRIVVLNKGQIIRQGDPFTIFQDNNLLEFIGLESPKVIHFLQELKKNGCSVDDIKAYNLEQLIDQLAHKVKKKHLKKNAEL